MFYIVTAETTGLSNSLILLGVLSLLLVIVLISVLLVIKIIRAKENVCKGGHDWETRDIKTAVSNHRCISHNYRIVFCKKCGLKKTSKDFR